MCYCHKTDPSSLRNIVLLCIVLQGKVKTQSFCIVPGFKEQKSHAFKKQRSHGSQLTLAPFGFHICYSFDVKYLQTTKFFT